MRRACQPVYREPLAIVLAVKATAHCCLACREGRTEALKALLEAGADVNIGDNDGDTALHLAAEMGHAAVVEALLAAGSPQGVQNVQGQTALALAQANSHGAVVELLRKKRSRAGESSQSSHKAPMP